jgi:hypothetical protein
VIFSFTRYPAPERKRIKITIAARYATPATITMGSNASITIRIRKPDKPRITSRSRASITGIFAVKGYMYIRTSQETFMSEKDTLNISPVHHWYDYERSGPGTQ